MDKMRGKTFHNYIVEQTCLLLTSLGWVVFLEYCICRNGVTNFVDILATMYNFNMAFEIETTPRHIKDNCQKAYAVGIPLCVVVPTSKLYKTSVDTTSRLNIQPAGLPIRVFKLSQLQQGLTSYLSLIIAANSNTDR